MGFTTQRVTVLVFAASLLVLSGCHQRPSRETIPRVHQMELHKLEYNNPDAVVDLDVGFKSVPLPMDFDGDGDFDLLVSETGSYVESGVFYFENISGNVEMPLFRPGARVSTTRFRLGYEGMLEVSQVNGHVHVLTADNANRYLLIYKDVPQNVFWARRRLGIRAMGYVPETKFTRWKMIDFDHDGVFDLLCGLDTRRGEQKVLFFKGTGSEARPFVLPPREIKLGPAPEASFPLQLEVAVADFDNDGDYDYIAPDHYARFVYFENTGTPARWRFPRGKLLRYHGKPIQMVSHYGSATKPTAFDWNRDGHVDLLAGDEDGKVSFIKNTGKIVDGMPVFEPPRFFQQEAKYVDLGALAAPRVFDWDGDGRDDIVSGNGAGYIVFLRNLGGSPTPRWDKPELLKADGKVIRILPEGANWGYTTIDVGDWDEDGLPDILVNHINGNVLWFKNVGKRRKPELAPPQPVEVDWHGPPKRPAWVPGKARDNELLAPWRTSPLIMDFNGDGHNDLVMLDHEGYLAVYLRYVDSQGRLRLGPPERRFVYPDGKPVLLNGLPGSHSGRLKITFVDWDGDGDRDLIVSSKPAVDWMRNEGMKNGKMILRYMGRVVSRTLMGHTDGPTVADWNRDGIPDLVVGTETGVLYYWPRVRYTLTTTMTTEGLQKPASYPYFKR